MGVDEAMGVVGTVGACCSLEVMSMTAALINVSW